ncbi:MAG: LuxR family transcriptional regulator, partial [Anaerolineae bacterium]|nr:LuxR family transcriptional regulator [Anaerolineae bacterium]
MRFTPLTTKLHIPVSRETLVKRPRLIQTLNRSVRSKLCLLSAPAGFGKTTLLAAWSQRSQWPVAWVSLDAMDNDALRFWSYIVAALDKVEPCVGQHVL